MASSVAAGTSMTIEDELTWSICLELYKNPVSFPCLHSFCFDCIKGLSRQQPKQPIGVTVLHCPECRKGVELWGGVERDLVKNFSLANIVDKFRKEKERISIHKETCSSHGKDIALYCMTCWVLLCTDCFQDHKAHDVDNLKTACEKYLVRLLRYPNYKKV